MTVTPDSFLPAFAKALFAPGGIADPAMRELADQPAFAVYRNTVLKGCVDALESNFPAVARLVGSAWFRAAAARYAAAEPPLDGRLMSYGTTFPDFLADFGPAMALPYLPGVARLDAMWGQAHVAADATLPDAAWLAHSGPEALGRLVLVPHPATRWAWFAAQPIFSIWQRNRVAGDGADADAAELAWHGEGALITRPRDAVISRQIGEADCAFLDACAAGLPLAEAAERALAVQSDADIAALLEGLLRAGAFASPVPPPCTESPS